MMNEMGEIRLNIGSFWENFFNVESDIESINWNIRNNKGKKIIIDLPISYFDSNIFNRILDLNAIEFEATDGRRYQPKDILLTNNKLKNMTNHINNSNLSQFEKFIAIYSFVTNYKPYKLSDKKYFDIGRSPYLFLDDDYINCAGICQFLCILCRYVGINITMFADEANEHAVCYFYIQDDKYGIDGYFSTDPTNDNKSKDNLEIKYTNMIGRIIGNNDFEEFLNSNKKLSYPKDMVDISLFSKYISFLETCDFLIKSNDNPIELLYSFRDKFQSKQNSISYHVIYNAILKVLDYGLISTLNCDIDILENLLFIKEYKEKTIAGESTKNLIESFVDLSKGKRK